MRNRPARALALVCVCLGCSTTSALADEPAAPAPTVAAPAAEVPKPMPLQQMLAQIPALQHGTLFCVDAVHTLPVDPEHPEDALRANPAPYLGGLQAGEPGPFTLQDATRGYDRMIQRIGNLTVLAPAHMVLLNTDLGRPDPYEGMEPEEAFKVLLASLTKDQWAALESKQGLAVSDLASDEQRHLMLHVLGGHGRLMLHSMWPWGVKPAHPQPNVDVTDQISNLHIRLIRHVNVSIQTGKHSFVGGYSDTDLPKYWIANTATRSAIAGQAVRTVVPAVLKTGDVGYSETRWDHPVSVQNGATLGQLVADVGVATHTELYCDKRMEALTITLLSAGAAQARAGDLLQAAALCVAGTFRKVGPAYVLTNDVVGLDTRREQLYRYVEVASKERHSLLDSVSDSYVAEHPLTSLPLEGDPSVAITEDQWKDALAIAPTADPGARSINVPFARLSPAQQAEARAVVDQVKAQPDADPRQQHMPPLSESTVQVEEIPTVTATLDNVDGAMIVRGQFRDVLLASSNARAAVPETSPVDQLAQLLGSIPPSLHPLLDKLPQRGCIVSVSSPDQLPGILRDMQRIGLNALWLNVFSQGKSHILAEDGKHKAVNMAARAVQLAEPCGIRVYAVADLYQWGPNAPAELADRTVLGETSAESLTHDPRNPVQDTQVLPVYVSPFSPVVANILAALHKQLGTVHGLAGLVWLDTAPAGYDDDTWVTKLGFTEPARMRFLEKEHVDPIDIGLEHGSQVDTSVPFLSADWATELSLTQHWTAFLRAHDVAALLALRVAALHGSTATQRPLFVQERSGENWHSWFGSWDSPTAPLPRFHYEVDVALAGGSPDDVGTPVQQAKSQSHAALQAIRLWNRATAADVARELASQPAAPQWDGVVLCRDDAGTKSLADRADADAKWLSNLAEPAWLSILHH